IDIDRIVVLDLRREALQILLQLGAVYPADKDFRETQFILWYAVCRRRIVHGKCSLVEVALEFKSRVLDELLVFRLVMHRGQLPQHPGASHPLEIQVNKAVSPRQQACRLRRSMLAKLDCGRDRHGYQQDAKKDWQLTS